MDQVNILAWEGRSEEAVGAIAGGTAAQMHATLGNPREAAPVDGDVLPPLWHWCAFPPVSPMSELGRDGHPLTGDFMPPLRLQRRMWAGGHLRFHGPARVGERLQRRSQVAAIEPKSEDMVLVRVDHSIHGERGLIAEERQDIVYLPIPERFTPPRKRPVFSKPILTQHHRMSEALLFRFSALTFNAHRIHYDLAYAQQVEAYPALVVHGPLQAMLLMQAACESRGTPPVEFSFRAVHPAFVTGALEVRAEEDEDGVLHLCSGQDGHQCMQATAIWQGVL